MALKDDDPRWDEHSGGDGHRGTKWGPGDGALAADFYRSAGENARLIPGLLMDPARALCARRRGPRQLLLRDGIRVDRAGLDPRWFGQEAWEEVRGAFVEAFRLASAGDFDAVDDLRPIRSAATLRTKALYVYFPGEMLPINSSTHLAHFIAVLGGPAGQRAMVEANRTLLRLLRERPEFRLSCGAVYQWPRWTSSVRGFRSLARAGGIGSLPGSG